jgi:hypothetical protein
LQGSGAAAKKALVPFGLVSFGLVLFGLVPFGLVPFGSLWLPLIALDCPWLVPFKLNFRNPELRKTNVKSVGSLDTPLTDKTPTTHRH